MSLPPFRKSWIIPAAVTIFIFIGQLAGNYLLEESLKEWRWLLWTLLALSGLLTVILAIQASRESEQSTPIDRRAIGKKYNEQREHYLQLISNERRDLSLSLFDPRSANPNTAVQRKLQMADVYIALNTKERREAKSDSQIAQWDRPMSALEALAKYPHLVLLGEPGGGKTTFVNHLAFCLAMNKLEPRKSWDEKLGELPAEWLDRLPVPVVLRDLAAWIRIRKPEQKRVGLLEAYLDHRLQSEGLSEFRSALLDELREGSALLLLDGLDEIPPESTEDELKLIKEMITALPSAYPKLSIVVTCRVLSYQDPRWKLAGNDWKTIELERFSDEQIDQFIQTWYVKLAAIGEKDAKDVDDLVSSLSNAVRKRDLRRLAPNPLLLTAMANVHAYDLKLPDARVLLYKRIVELLMVLWDARRQGGDQQTTWRKLLEQVRKSDDDVQDILWGLAYDAHTQTQLLAANESDEEKRNELTGDIADGTLWKALAKLHPSESIDWAKLLLDEMKLRAGLLVENPTGVFRFPHRTFQEYLAGSYLTQTQSAEDNPTDTIFAHAQKGVFWWEVVLLAVGRWWYVLRDIDRPIALMRLLCPPTLPTDEFGWRNVWLAGRCILEIGVETLTSRRPIDGKETVDRVRDRLLHLITHDLLSPRERAEAGSVLSAIGDPRNFEEMVEIPAGEFLMGSLDGDKDAQESEKPRHKLFVDSFCIAKYSVTNGQYARFVEATGHRPPSHWRGTKPPDELRNHPVIYVSWHDARAYCEWLSEENKEKGKIYRLPSEAEWEKAARGQKGNIYPWGNKFDPEKCNMGDTGVEGTSPVGIFTAGVAGKSPDEIYDLAGNVWEWTSSLWGEDSKPDFGYPYDSQDGREDLTASNEVLRVVRGGAFSDLRNGVRCAYRFRYNPLLDWYVLGFRVVSPGC